MHVQCVLLTWLDDDLAVLIQCLLDSHQASNSNAVALRITAYICVKEIPITQRAMAKIMNDLIIAELSLWAFDLKTTWLENQDPSHRGLVKRVLKLLKVNMDWSVDMTNLLSGDGLAHK